MIALRVRLLTIVLFSLYSIFRNQIGGPRAPNLYSPPEATPIAPPPQIKQKVTKETKETKEMKETKETEKAVRENDLKMT